MKEDVMMAKDVLRDPSRGTGLREGGEGTLTAQPPAPQPRSHAEPELAGHLSQLLPHPIMADKEHRAETPPHEESRIPRQEDPPLAPRKSDEPTVLGIPEIPGVVPQDAS